MSKMHSMDHNDKLALISNTLHDMGLNELHEMLMEALDIFRTQIQVQDLPLSIDEMGLILSESNMKLHRDIAAILDLASAESISLRNPTMESKACCIASDLIMRKGICTKDFESIVSKTLSDANDDVILNLLEFQ